MGGTGNFGLEALAFSRFGKWKIDPHRDDDRDGAPDRRLPVASGNQVMADDGRRRPRDINKGFGNDVPLHQEKAAGRQDQGVENIGHHEDGVEHNRKSEKDGFVDLKNLGDQRQAADFSKTWFGRVEHDEGQCDCCSRPPDVDKGRKKTERSNIGQRESMSRCLDVGGEVLEKNGSDDGVEGIVAIDPDRP